jgi:hypothetical protein
VQSVYEDVARDTNRWVAVKRCMRLNLQVTFAFILPLNKIFEIFNCNFFIIWRRGHTVQAVLGCFELSKDAGFKIVTHMMPNLPNVDMQRDFEQFRCVSLVVVKRQFAHVFAPCFQPCCQHHRHELNDFDISNFMCVT